MLTPRLDPQYDLVELRAITACLPKRFEVDGDGRKAAWRAAFLQRVQGLVAQVGPGRAPRHSTRGLACRGRRSVMTHSVDCPLPSPM